MAEVTALPAKTRFVVPLLGVAQIVSWGSSYYLLAVLSRSIASDTGWALPWVVAGGSIGLLASGLSAPVVGRLIGLSGGRITMAAGSLLIGLGLIAVGLAPNVAAYLCGWTILGVGMGAGLYDAAFSTLGRLFGSEGRRATTNVTLWGGFASTVFWPASAFAVEHFGWRGACFMYAAVHVLVMAPALFGLLPREERKAPTQRRDKGQGEERSGQGVFGLLAAILMLNGAIQTVVSVHLLTLLQARGVGLGAAIMVGTLIGPSQVGARVLEMIAGRRLHPVQTLIAAAVLIAIGMVMLGSGLVAAALAIVLYAAGNGVWSIARGTVPLALFGAAEYPEVMGKLAMPNLVAQAAAPFAAGVLISTAGGGRRPSSR